MCRGIPCLDGVCLAAMVGHLELKQGQSRGSLSMTHLGHLGRTAGVRAGLGQGSLGALHWGHLGSMVKPGTGSGKGMGVCCARSTLVGQWKLKQVWTRGSQGMLHLGHLRWTAGAGTGVV